ncbi:nucleosidase [Dysgonomonas sp. ZJ279]|uniref:5'-methylthioadenosine/S-adenosylhomocysteine nucleosidase family protein n=1 Tax=Dysgonomonas sp. ZJ279 TaxID=2709796 RepID=UPI0013EC0926|nr:nucleosidase [Dysgonomonas sp. ZJ279]
MNKILVTYAVKEEFVPITINGCKIEYLHTGIGKIRSAMMLTKALCENRPDLVLNMGTAGTHNHRIGNIFVCRRFIDRDYEMVKLPGVEFEVDLTPIHKEKKILEDWTSTNGRVGTCNTGDSFVTEITSMDGDVVDMEAFAQAIVCREFDIPFLAVKYVTDIIGENSVKHWEDKLSDARKGFEDWFKDK